jgi:hypothetical protein
MAEMSDQTPNPGTGPAPESPGVVKKAQTTVAKPKVKPSPPTPAVKASPDPEPETAPEPEGNQARTSSNVFSIFGWGD